MEKNQFFNNVLAVAAMFFMAQSFTSCALFDTEDEEEVNLTGIPADKDATPDPIVTDENTVIPNFQYMVEYEHGEPVIRLDLTGIQNPNNLEWMRLCGTGSPEQNVWVSVDGMPKGFTVSNSIDNENHRVVNVDLVFLIDNSGSMGQESDTLAADVVSWAQKLSRSTMDIRFGCVGYDGRITGGIDFTTADGLYGFLNREGRYSTSRSKGFEGGNAEELAASTSPYDGYRDQECGVAALRFADEHFSFRPTANRIYVNLTDEPNYTMGREDLSCEYVNNIDNWPTSKGTVHTVYSADTTSTVRNYYERPWLLSQYTGGTIMTAPSNFRGVSLDVLPVTGAIQNSAIIRFANARELLDGNFHEVKITVLSPDKTVRAQRTISVRFTD